MPGKRKYTRKRTYKRRYKKKSPSSAMGPLANTLKANLIYSERFTLNPGVGGIIATQVFSANGVFDPNISGTGHQPRGFDQLMTLYDHVIVIGAKITLQVQNTDGIEAANVVLTLRDNDSVDIAPDNIMEYRFIKNKIFGPLGSGGNVGTVQLACNPNRFLGRSKPLSDPQLKNSVAANPTEGAFFHVSVFPSSSADMGDIDIYARIEYTCICVEPRQPAVS